MMHPYRVASPPAAYDVSSADGGIATLAIVIWAGSVARALLALALHEAPDREVVLAVMLVLALPFTARLWR